MATEKLRCLRKLTSLKWLDLSGTGAHTRSLDAAPTGCYVVASRATDVVRPGMDDQVNYRHVYMEIQDTEHDGPPDDNDCRNAVARLLRDEARQSDMRVKYSDYGGRSLREKALESTLDRMLAVCQAAGIDPAFARQRPLVEAFARRWRGRPYANARGVGPTFSEFLEAAKSNLWLWRLYAAASDLHFADALRAHIQYLDGVKQKWALTDVELEEYEEAPASVRICLRDASAQLGVRIEPSSAEPMQNIAAIWTQTRPLPKPQSYVSYWEE